MLSREGQIALEYLQESQHLREDAERYSSVDNTVMGSLLSTLYGIPRWRAEQAVKEALAQLKRKKKG
jgi:hypothetical protein